MNFRNLGALFLIWLGLSLIPDTGVTRLDLTALSPGNNGVYPYTYVGAAASFVAVALAIYFQENKKLWAIPLAIIAANASSIGMLNVYEQVWVSLNQTAYHYSSWFILYWSNETTATWSIIGMLWVLASAPWWNRKNLRLVLPTLVIFCVSMGIWFLLGMPTANSGSSVGLTLNAISRISSQVILIFLCLPWKLKFSSLTRSPRFMQTRPLLPIKKSEQTTV
jgi:hypothetical protein